LLFLFGKLTCRLFSQLERLCCRTQASLRFCFGLFDTFKLCCLGSTQGLYLGPEPDLAVGTLVDHRLCVKTNLLQES